MTLLVVVVSFLVLVAAGCAFGYLYVQKLYREQKNFERGLKMVPLLIHLPPPSEDTSSEGRDARDVVNENISRAQVLYGILASTFQKGFKSRFYGQRHIALEIMAGHGAVRFYVAVPVALQSVVEQAVVSAYPAARLEEVAEHNIFSPVGHITGTMGGELNLKEHFAYPIATFEDIKRDTMQALLNSLSTLEQQDGAGIQILLRPAQEGWRRSATTEAEKKKSKPGSSRGVENLSWVGQAFGALNKPPEAGEEKGKDEKQPSALEQSITQAIEDKTRHPGFEVMIRLVASSNISQKAQTILNNIVAAFALYDAPGKNGFKFVPARDIDSFVTAYILRFFPQATSGNILNAVELATLFHFPEQASIPTSKLERQTSKQVDGPRNVPEEGLLLGYNMFRGAKKAIRLSEQDRHRHVYIVGQTGTGKSVLMENLALQDMLEGRGFAFIDPHGDTAEKLLSMIPKERTEDVIYFSPADMDYPLGLNMFEYQTAEQKDFLIQETINMLYKLYDPQRTGIIGPRYEHIFRNAALTIMADPEGGSFVDIPKLFRDPAFVDQKLKHVTDQNVIEFWRKEMAQFQRSTEFGDVISWFVSKFGAFLSNEMMRNIIGQTKSSFDLRSVMDESKILLVNLSRGRVGDLNSKLLGMIFVMKFEAAAMSRADMPEEYRKNFCLYVDEFQNFSTDSFADMLSQARKYHLNLIVANQFTTQLTDEVRDSVFGNVGSVISFRVGTNDAEFLTKQFAPIFDIDDLQFLPNYNTAVRMMIGGVPVQPFSMATIPQLGSPNPQLSDALKQLSAAKYGRPKTLVEQEIFKRMETKAPLRPTMRPGGFGDNLSAPPPLSSLPAGQAGRPPRPATPRSGSSFLDEWLTKRKSSLGRGPRIPTAGPSAPWDTRPNPVPPPTSVPSPPRPAPVSPPPVIEATTQNPHQGELKIKRTVEPDVDVDLDGEMEDIKPVHIDKDGNLTYEQ
ncbi:hypothetical protein A3E49_02210 [Candidatus Saccharibacteria bacterium RIFCSPHIGHO2_12_FULL_49_19]|nr:MAG: hypothetical protein A3E49_02210 [Candidatus Saccharibacteria bacterium RIFCSPHIGHO2_12_FULL_49_19]